MLLFNIQSFSVDISDSSAKMATWEWVSFSAALFYVVVFEVRS